MNNFIDFSSNTVVVNWSKFWANRGHILGEGMVSPDEKYFYIKIPKNSSSFAVKHLTDLGWTHSVMSQHPHASILMAVRDPLDRWISGIVEYLFMYHIEQIDHIVSMPPEFDFWPLIGERLGLSLIFDQVTFDDHTAWQSVFLDNVNLNKCQALMVDENFSKNFSSLLNSIGYPNTISLAEKINSHSSADPTANRKRLLREVIQFILDRDYERKPKILKHLEPDYQLVKSANFYRRENV